MVTMPLAPATRLGPYEIATRIGVGGMGEVYLARDTRLGRDVALKILAPEKAGERARRNLLEEARAASALNHPNIVIVYDVGTQDDIDYIAMEYIRGQTIRDLQSRHGLSLAEVLRYSIPIADALARAHAAGITHSDIKPSNIMVNEEGVAKLLDFGLSKNSLTEKISGTGAETVSMHVTTGVPAIAGTVSYMSPEQARGMKMDGRSDIFSFGLVLYEMLSGRCAFPGEDVLSVVGAIIHKAPEPIRVTADIPTDMVGIVMRCLRKDAARRYQHAGDLRIALEDLRDERGANAALPPETPPPSRRNWLERTLLVALAVAASIAGMLWYLNRPRPPLRLQSLTQVTFDPGLTTTPAISADGKLLAYASDRAGRNLDIWVQQSGGGEPIRLTKESADSYDPTFSPDGTTIVYRSEIDGGGLYSLPSLGGQIRRIARDGRRPRFSPDGKWIAYRIGHPQWSLGEGGIYVMPATGGSRRQLHANFASAGDVIWSPDSRHYLFSGVLPLNDPLSGPGPGNDRGDWWLSTLDDDKIIRTGGLAAVHQVGLLEPQLEAWDPEGNFVIFSARSGDSFNLWKIPIAIETGKVTGTAEPLTFGTTHQRTASISATGLLAFSSLSWKVDAWSFPIDPRDEQVSGKPEQLTSDGTVGAPSVSMDGDRMVFLSNRSGNPDVWLRDLKTGLETQITATPFAESIPVISADGMKVTYRAREGNKDNVYSLDLPTSGRPAAPQKICDGCGAPLSWSPDGSALLILAGTPLRALSYQLSTGRLTELVKHSSSNIFEPQFSADGKWFLFLVHGPGRSRVYAVPYRAAMIPEADWIPLTDGLSWEDKPRWARDDRAIYFTSDRDGFRCIWAQRLDAAMRPTGAAFVVFHAHNSRLSLMNVAPGALDISLARDRLIFNQGEETGNVWLTNLPRR
jgi:serine/threonine protein kinase